MAINIRIATKEDQGKWDDFVHSQKEMGPYHLFGWKTAVEKAYNHSSVYLMAEDEKGSVQGVLPLIHIKPPFVRGCMVSLPFCDYGGVLASDKNSEALLVKKAVDLARSSRVALEIRCKSASMPYQVLPHFDVMSHKSRMILPLSKNSETLFSKFKSKLRSQIKRPQKEGMFFKMGSTEFINDFYLVYSHNMRELGSPVHSKSWLHSVLDSFDGKANLGMVYKDSTPVAGGLIISCNDTVTIPWASSLSQYNKMSPNMLLYWSLLRYASDSGYKEFDFGRSTPGEGTYKFKEQWGAEPSPLYWYSITSNGGNPMRRFIGKVWAIAPQIFTDRIGPLLRRYIRL